MNILVTGANGFVGKNLVEALKNIRDKKDRTHNEINIESIMTFDRDNTLDELSVFCVKADFIFHLAGVNRPQNNNEFNEVNLGLTTKLLSVIKLSGRSIPVMFASSIQASLKGRFKDSTYGKSKLAAEKALIEYSSLCNAKVFIYRFPNLFGKWCRPNYNSVVATFCNNIASGIPIKINDENTELELLYIDDLIEEMLQLLAGKGSKDTDYQSMYYRAPITYKVTVGEIAKLLYSFNHQPKNLLLLEIPAGSFASKLYATYLSYLPAGSICFDLEGHFDERGSFTELIKTLNCGQFSVNISKPGITKGQHWHNTKWEIFIVVSGHGLIQERRIGSEEVLEFNVSGDRLQAVHMLPGYTHNIINLSNTENLVTLMWASEVFNPDHPDTFYEEV